MGTNYMSRIRKMAAWLWRMLVSAWRLVYPPTKKKLLRLLHILGGAITIALMIVMWIATKEGPWWERIGATTAPLVSLLTNWRSCIGWAERQVAESNLPEDDEPEALAPAAQPGQDLP